MLAQRLAEIESRIQGACDETGRQRSDVVLVAVSKTVSIAQIQEAYNLGVRDFGESRLQEAIPKIEALPGDIRWHFIGHLQSNKAKRVAQLFQVVHSVSNRRQLEAMEAAEGSRDFFVEVNIGKEEEKSGLLPEDLDAFLPIALQYKHSRFCGLMAIGPAEATTDEKRKLFSEVRTLNEKAGGSKLSLGMSGDFELGIQEGATHVRIGTAIFGSR